MVRLTIAIWMRASMLSSKFVPAAIIVEAVVCMRIALPCNLFLFLFLLPHPAGVLTVGNELVGSDIADGDTGHFGGCEGGCRR